MTQQEKRDIVRRYHRATNEGLYDVYTKPSHNKINAYEKIFHEMVQNGGWGLKILSYNTFMFTCAYQCVDENGVIHLVYHTPSKKEVFEM